MGVASFHLSGGGQSCGESSGSNGDVLEISLWKRCFSQVCMTAIGLDGFGISFASEVSP